MKYASEWQRVLGLSHHRIKTEGSTDVRPFGIDLYRNCFGMKRNNFPCAKETIIV